MKTLFFLLSTFAAAAPAPKPVRFASSDRVTVAALYRAPKTKKDRVVLFVHGVGAGKGEWDGLSDQLAERGFGTLAIDLRGHGESTGGSYKNFDRNGRWPGCLNDLIAAVAFLKKKGVKSARVGVIGGSIGANLASQLAAQNKFLPFIVLLSPGSDYHGVADADLTGRRVLAAASPGDPYALEEARLAGAREGATFLQAGGGHGAQMLREPEFVDALLDWIAKSP